MAYEDNQDDSENEQTGSPSSQESDQASQSSEEGEWVRSPKQAAPPQEAQGQDEGEWVRSPTQGPPPEEKTEPESQFEAGSRSTLKSIVPSAVGAVGVGLGGFLGNIPGAILGGLAFGSAAYKAQDWILKNLFGYDDSKIEAANREAHPWTTGFGDVLGAAPTIGLGALPKAANLAAQAGTRLTNAAITGSIDYAAGGDLQHAGGAALGGALISGAPTRGGAALIEGGENVGKKLTSLLAQGKATSEETGNILSTKGATVGGAATKPEGTGDYPPGRPADAATPGAEVEKADAKTPGTNTPGGYGGRVATPPLEDVAVGNPGSKPTQSNREGGKDHLLGEEGGNAPAPLGQLDPAVEAVMRKEGIEPRRPGEPRLDASPEEINQRMQEQGVPPRQQAQQEQPKGPPPPAEGSVRFYHGGHEPTSGGPRWVTPDLAYAQNFRRGETPNEVHYVDVPKGHPAEIAARSWDELDAGTNRVGHYQNTEFPEELAKQMKPVTGEARTTPADQTPELVKSLQEAEAKRAADAENPPAGPEISAAMQRTLDAAAKHAPTPRGPPREPPKPPGEPPEPGPKDARLNKPPLLESKGGGPFNSLRRTFAPEFMSPASEKAAGALRRGQGIMEGLNKEWAHKLEKHFPAMEKLIKNGEMEAFTERVEGGDKFPEYKIPKELEGAAADIKEMYKAYKEKAAEISKDPEAVRAWNDNFVTHIYKDEPKSFWDRVGGGGIQGSGGSLKARKYNTYAEAKEAEGLEPRHKNILNTGEAYRTELGKHIATEMAKKEMREGGHLKYGMPEPSVGASGQMSSLKEGNRIHKDWEPVANMSMGGRQAYMPRDAANVFNNHLSPGLKGNKYIAPFYQSWREAANRFTGTELGLFNGFHAFVTGGESVLSNQARGVSELAKSAKHAVQGNLKDAGLELSAAGKSILTAPAAPVANYHAGRRYMAIAEGNDKPWSVFSPIRKFKQPTETEKLMTKASQEAGVMPHGRGYAPDENLSSMGTYTQSYMRGQFGREMSEMAQRVKDNPFKGVPVEVWNTIGRSMQTMSEPLFGHYIPALKYGTLMKDMESFLRQSKVDMRTPQGFEAAVRFLRKQSNAMDTRIGEANMNNAFMNKSIQDAMYGLLRSFSWAKGTTTAILGGPGGVVKTLGEGAVNKDMGAAMRKLANKLDMTHKDYDPNLTYSIAFPFGTALIGTAYQLLKSGEMPSSLKDLYLPRTGGLVPGVGGRGKVEERVPLPGYHKEIRGAIHEPVKELTNKQNSLLTTLEEQATGKDWKDQPIVRPNATLTENLTDRAKHLQQKLLNPLMLKNVTATPPEGSNISRAERVLGFKGAGKAYIDPEKDQEGAEKRYEKAWKSSKEQEWREEHGGRGTIPTSTLKKSLGTAVKPSTLTKQDEWVRSPKQGPPP